jgi:hypothetical protein
MKKKSVCLICFKPNDIWVDFLSTFTKYDIYIIIDDNSKDYKPQYSKFSNINIIQIIDDECKKNGFSDTCSITIPKKITGWSKAIYYFSSVNTNYNNVWFFEDDVFFYNEKTLIRIDSKYDNSDLLSTSYDENIYGHKNFWLWSNINIKFAPPYYKAMICSIRCSKQLLSKIKDYADEYETLFFSEALFPTICKKHRLQYDTPYELQNIVWRKNYISLDIDKTNMFHPVKDINMHTYFRDMLNKKKVVEI